ncbi:phosphotransferase [Mycoplasmopsis citelli]|uniref:phosphotransferase n=1 Tax=Mycoplasmopsis citelli TaxID=171281 RepID=UPI0021157183|nr:phosphotransferase [Mycoplasmopsis citelli]UUD36193.1 phosphotransferase [Mycoplasmopsis citelli]
MSNLVEKHLNLVSDALTKQGISKVDLIKLEYEGFHNYTYLAQINDKKYQVRIKKNFLKEQSNSEKKYYLKDKETLYYDENLLIREWFEGETLENLKLTKEIQVAVLKHLKEFSNKDINVEEFDWFEQKINLKEYSEIIKKFKNKPKILQHGDLALKNILINKQNQVKFIDLEWIRLNFIGFDAATLYKEGFDEKLILENLEITKEEFKDLLFICDTFNNYVYKINYIPKIKEEVKKLQPIESFSKSSYRLNDKIVQFKNDSNLFLTKELGNEDFLAPILYEDEKLILRKWIPEQKFHFCKGNLRRLSTKIKKFHQLPNQQKYIIDQFIFNLYQKFQSNKWVQSINQNIIDKIFINLKNPQNLVLSHNDLHPGNIIMSNNDGRFKFIDLVNASLNSKYFDLAYLSTNLNLNEDKELHLLKCYDKKSSVEEFYKYKCIVNFYGLLWSLELKDFSMLEVNLSNINKYQQYL